MQKKFLLGVIVLSSYEFHASLPRPSDSPSVFPPVVTQGKPIGQSPELSTRLSSSMIPDSDSQSQDPSNPLSSSIIPDSDSQSPEQDHTPPTREQNNTPPICANNSFSRATTIFFQQQSLPTIAIIPSLKVPSTEKPKLTAEQLAAQEQIRAEQLAAQQRILAEYQRINREKEALSRLRRVQTFGSSAPFIGILPVFKDVQS